VTDSNRTSPKVPDSHGESEMGNDELDSDQDAPQVRRSHRVKRAPPSVPSKHFNMWINILLTETTLLRL
jgi:hypothetical protein